MTMGGGGGKPAVAGGSARHIPVLARPAIEYLNVHDGGIYIDGTFGAGGYARLILEAADAKVIGIDRDQTRGGARLRPGRSVGRPADAGGRPLLVARSRRAGMRLRCRRRRRARHRRLFHAARRGRTRLFLPAGRPARHADGQDRGRARPMWSRRRPSAISPISFSCSARSGIPARSRAPSSTARKEQPIETTGALAEIVARVVRGKPGEIHPATRTFQALRIFVNEELGELAAGAGRGRAHSETRRAAGRRLLPFARRPHREDLPCRAQPHALPARAICRPSRRRRRPSTSSPSVRWWRTTQRSPPIRAPARPSCAPASARKPRRARPAPGSRFDLPSPADLVRGR